MNNPYIPLSNNYFNKVKEPDDFRRSGSNFDTFGSRYQSNKLQKINKGKIESNFQNISLNQNN